MESAQEKPNSIVLFDWGADDRSLGDNPDAILYELLLLSLLYDKVLIEDVIFALNEKIAKWFTRPEYAYVLRKCFEIGSVVVLKHPSSAYPDDELKESSKTAPIETRATYIERFGTRGVSKFKPTERQRALYKSIDSCLLLHKNSHQPVAVDRFAIMPAFADLLKTVLSEKVYSKWRTAGFRGVTNTMANDFVRYIDRPEMLVTRLRAANQQAVVLRDSEDRPVFNRSLAFQAARLYPRRQELAMQRLVSTVFAARFTQREEAGGRYSRFLREFIWLPPGSAIEEEQFASIHDIVAAEAHVDLSVGLPQLSTDFVEAIQAVRGSPAGEELRKSVQRIDQQATFDSQVSAWREVADALATLISKRKPVSLRVSLLKIGGEIISGCVAGGLADSSRATPTALLQSLVPEAALGVGIGIASGHVYRLLKSTLRQQNLRARIEQTVQFRYASVAMPPVVAPSTGKSDMDGATKGVSKPAS